ncbi:hypothetical protein R1sor_011761 [Riccia sorocarpa]|uniref:Uncharacterized protein n=1 Tax=Riccia sorocarpa TaxID=122646 RepID=A0ABD3I5N8_9MARC
MAISLCSQGIPACNGSVMGKKYNRFLQTYKKAQKFYLGKGAGLTDEEIAAGLTLEQKMNQNYSQPVHASSAYVEFSGEEEEAADREEDPIDFFDNAEEEVVDNHTATENHGRDGAVPAAMEDDDGGPGFGNQTVRSALDVEEVQPVLQPQNAPHVPSRRGVSNQSGEELRSSGRDRPPISERKNSLISAYEDQVKEKLVLRKAAQEHKLICRDTILDDRRQDRARSQTTRQNCGST